MKNIHLISTDKPSRIVKNTNNQIKLTIQTLPKDLELGCYPQNIYITNDKKIKEGDWHFNLALNLVEKTTSFHNGLLCEKIILTTDQDLIKDGVRAIDDEFLEWFVKNPSCERVEVEIKPMFPMYSTFIESIDNPPFYGNLKRKIIIPQEEPNYNIKLEVEWVLNNPQCKQIESCSKSLSKKCICPKEESKQETTLEKDALNIIPDRSTSGWVDSFSATERIDFIKGAKWQAERMYSEEEVYNLLCSMPNFFNMTIPQQIKARNNWFKQFKK